MLAGRTGSLVSTTSWRLFQVEKPVSDRIALSRHVVIVLAGSRQVRRVFVVIARWTLENDQTYEPGRHFFDAVFTYFLLGHCVRHRLRQFSRILLLGRPTQYVGYLYFTSVSSSFFFFFFFLSFFRPLISEVAERNSTEIGHMVGSKCNLKTHVRNLGYPFHLQIGGPKTTFLGRLRNLRATVTPYIFGKKHDIDNRSSALTRGLLHLPKMHELWSTNGFKLDLHFYPPSVNSAFWFIARLRRRRSANRTQPHFAKRRMVNRANNLLQNSWGRPPRKNWGPINFNISSVFRRLRHLLANIFWMKRDTDNRARALESTKGLLHFSKIWWTLVYKRLQTRSDFFPTLTILFHTSPSNTL